METDLLLYANFYHNIGINITHISGNTSDIQSFKAPTDPKWEEYITKRQSINYLHSQTWDKATGIGMILGYNGYRAIDIDNFFYGYRRGWFSDEEVRTNFSDFIQTCLCLLRLPNDYQWVIKSGSGWGCHIILKTKDIQYFDISSLPYAPNCKNIDVDTHNNSFYESALFERMELRWRDHLVLPPSIHQSGGKYDFYHKKLPSYSPLEVSIENVNNLINYYCGDETFDSYNYKNKKLYLAKLKKAYAECHSWTRRLGYEITEDNYNWLLKCQSPSALNSLGVAYTLGKGVHADSNKAKSCFEQANNSHAHFNLANLIACGYIDGHPNEVNRHLSFCEDIPNEYKEFVRANAMCLFPPPPPPMFCQKEEKY